MNHTSIPDMIVSGADKVIETSCALIVLKGQEAFKIKKPVDFGFLDYSTKEKRLWALKRELEFNSKTSDDIYRSVDVLEGEPVLRMRRFDDKAVLAQRFDRGEPIDLELMDIIGRNIAAFHTKTDQCKEALHSGNTAYVIGSNRENIASFADELGPALVEQYDMAINTAYAALEAVVLNRLDQGFIRRCHGDLHLGNILIENHQPVLFDCIEFNDRLIQIDILYDLAFLLMDLWVRDQQTAANRVMNSWLEAMARNEHDVESLYESLKLLPLYLSVRAAVRCHVNAHASKSDPSLLIVAQTYLKAALGFLEFDAPKLVAIGGLSGSGKSFQARKIASSVGRPAGAVILRSDDVRKRLWGCPALNNLPQEAYSQAHSLKTLTDIKRLASAVLTSGQSVIIDATFRDEMWRNELQSLSLEKQLPFTGFWLDVSDEERLGRVTARINDISDATIDIAASQAMPENLSENWQRVNEISL